MTDLALPECLVGIEVELFDTDENQIHNGWEGVHDGSLHGNSPLEYRLTEPLKGTELFNAINFFDEVMESVVHPTIGNDTSMHIHIDVRDMTIQQMVRFIMLYIMYEELLFNVYCPTRTSNIFCLQAKDTDYSTMRRYSSILSRLRSDLDVTETFREAPRYGGININSVSVLGSLEFRGHQATTNKEDILEWINVLQSLKQSAMEGDWVSTQPYLHAKHVGIVSFTESVFGEHVDRLRSFHDFYSNVHAGMQLTRIINNHNTLSLDDLASMGNPRIPESE